MAWQENDIGIQAQDGADHHRHITNFWRHSSAASSSNLLKKKKQKNTALKKMNSSQRPRINVTVHRC